MEDYNKEIKAPALPTPLISINDINDESQSLLDNLAGLRSRSLKFIKSLSLERNSKPSLQLNAHLRPGKQDSKNCTNVSEKRFIPTFSIVKF